MGFISVKFLLLILPFYWLFLRRGGETFDLTHKEVVLLLVVTAYVTLGVSFSVYRHNSLSFGADILTMLLFLFVVRRDRHISRGVAEVIGIVFNVISSMILSLTLIFYVGHHCSVMSLGFENMTDFKLLYRPLFMLCNDNATLLLCLLPFLTLMSLSSWKMRIWSAANMSMCVAAVLFSYSRGTYIAAVVFILVSLMFCILHKKKIVGHALVLMTATTLPSVVTVICSDSIRESVMTTATMLGTESQKRSFESRIERLRGVADSGESILCGAGEGNYFVSSLAHKTEYDTLVSASSNNGFLQLWKERGLVGLAFLAYIIMLCSVPSMKRIRKGDVVAILMTAGAVSLIVREMSFASLTRVTPVFFLGAVMIMLSSKRPKYEEAE